MREIKFRAYIEEDKKIYDVLSVFKSLPSETFQRVYINKEQGEGMPANYRITAGNKLMQFTGLKDKNGKEIFEGDIVKIKGASRTFYLCWYDNMCFAFNDVRNYPERSGYACYDTDEGFPRPDMIEIIGNIYEHPNLLK